jgi:hypothetical protein
MAGGSAESGRLHELHGAETRCPQHAQDQHRERSEDHHADQVPRVAKVDLEGGGHPLAPPGSHRAPPGLPHHPRRDEQKADHQHHGQPDIHEHTDVGAGLYL